MVRIESVTTPDRHRALALLGARRRGGLDLDMLESLCAGPEHDRCHLWWSRGALGGRAAAMTILNPGGTALLFHSSIDHCREKPDVLASLIRQVTAVALEGFCALVQAMLCADQQADEDVLLQAGYFKLAELIYMARTLREIPPAARRKPGEELAMVPVTEAGEEVLAHVIPASYADSLDCPLLVGLRTMPQVLAGHRACGVYRPESWWVARCGGQDAGCLLLNDSADGRSAEVVYLGLAPLFRGKGFGRAMLRHAYADAAGRGVRDIRLAVDAANPPAMALYTQEGFQPTDRRVVFIHPRPREER
jgi:GNAT superfamily N-acetyltransferase